MKKFTISSRSIFRLAILFLMLIGILPMQSQDFWEQINTPVGVDFNSVAVADNGDIYLALKKTEDSGGVIRSIDGGNTWEFIGLENHSVIALSFNHSGKLLAGVRIYPGIYIYNDVDGIWERVFNSSGNILTIEPGFNDIIFAGSAYINRSIDDGITWEEIFNPDDNGPREFAILSFDTVYYGSTNFLGGGGILKSVDAGNTWSPIGLTNLFIATIELNSKGDLYAGGIGQYYTGDGGVYILPSGSDNWDTLLFWPRILAMEITQDDIIYCGFLAYNDSQGGVMHSNDYGETWVLDTSGMGNIGISKLVLDKYERLYAISYPSPSKLFRSVLPVTVESINTTKKELTVLFAPNPFTTSTTLEYELVQPSEVKLSIFNQFGMQVELIQQYQQPGKQSLTWQPQGLPPGMYYFNLRAGDEVTTGKIVKIE